jgi:UDP-3-O-[3-hydroxymyristoyl] glucosamine N-acyltransferase
MVNVELIYEYLKESGVSCSLEGDPKTQIKGFSSLFNYKPGTMTFISSEYKFSSCESNFEDKCISLIITNKNESYYPHFNSMIKVDSPRQAFFMVIEGFFDESEDEEITGISSNPRIYSMRSYISNKARIGNNVKIGVGCVIEGDVEIGDNTEIHHNVVIRNKTRIGKNCRIHSGTIIGENGFGFVTDRDGTRHMLKHYGGVVIEDDVHISDNCCVIRGAIEDTVIKRGVKINTLAHIAHNSVIGENTLITVGTRILGSCKIGANSYIAAAYVLNQTKVGEGAILGLGSVVINDIEPGDKVVGNPARKILKKTSDSLLNG